MITTIDVSKEYKKRSILNSINVQINENEITIITGESGKGKTTLLNVLSFVDKPDSGTISIDNEIPRNNRQIMELRRHKISHIFQNYGLIDEYTVEKNLELSMKYRKSNKMPISEALRKVGMAGFEKNRIYQLSGGEQQRVALARTLLRDTKYIFADEPTGNLDRNNRDLVMGILKDLANNGKGIIMATHDLELLSYGDQIINL